MVTPNLSMVEVSESQNQKHITINDALTKIDEATQGSIIHSIVGDTTLSATNYENNFFHTLGGTPAGVFDFDVPATARFFSVSNISGQAGFVQVTGGGGDGVTVEDSENYTLYCDGSDVQILSVRSTLTLPYDFGFFYSGLPTDSQEVFRFSAVRAFTIPDAAVGSTALARVASTGTVVFSVLKDAVQFATVTFTASATGVWAFDVAADEVFAAGDVFTVTAPATADATLEDISILVRGDR